VRDRAYRTILRELADADEATVTTEREMPTYYKGVSKAERRQLRAGRFSIPDDLSGRTVLVIDDVVNTGSTLGALADAAADAGAARVLQLGYWAGDRSAIVATHATPAARRGSPFGVWISGDGHRERFHEAWEASGGHVTFLGDWQHAPRWPRAA
jgi:hypothetical protein